MAGFERTEVVDHTTYHIHSFAGGGLSKNIVLQNASLDTVAYVKFGTYKVAPSATDYDICLQAAMVTPVQIPDMSVTHLTTSPVDEVSIWRFPRTVN